MKNKKRKKILFLMIVTLCVTIGILVKNFLNLFNFNIVSFFKGNLPLVHKKNTDEWNNDLENVFPNITVKPPLEEKKSENLSKDANNNYSVVEDETLDDDLIIEELIPFNEKFLTLEAITSTITPGNPSVVEKSIPCTTKFSTSKELISNESENLEVTNTPIPIEEILSNNIIPSEKTKDEFIDINHEVVRVQIEPLEAFKKLILTFLSPSGVDNFDIQAGFAYEDKINNKEPLESYGPFLPFENLEDLEESPKKLELK